MESAFLSDVELYFTNLPIEGENIFLEGEECHHVKNVMRHKESEEIYITDGKGSIYQSKILHSSLPKESLRSLGQTIKQNRITCEIISAKRYDNKFSNIWFCIPKLKSPDRFEFALEKCVELGITNFIVFESARTVSKGEKIARWQKILLSAMKQSLRAWLPTIKYEKSISDLVKHVGAKIVFVQHAQIKFSVYLQTDHWSPTTGHYLIFGPEGGLTDEELKALTAESKGQREVTKVKLTENRLRSETAIVTAAALLSLT